MLVGEFIIIIKLWKTNIKWRIYHITTKSVVILLYDECYLENLSLLLSCIFLLHVLKVQCMTSYCKKLKRKSILHKTMSKVVYT